MRQTKNFTGVKNDDKKFLRQIELSDVKIRQFSGIFWQLSQKITENHRKLTFPVTS